MTQTSTNASLESIPTQPVPRVNALRTSAPSATVLTRRNLQTLAALFVAALVTFFLMDKVCRISLRSPSTNPYFMYQAWSWLHGHWYISVPGNKIDLITLHGKLYSIFSPFPAVLMLPFVAIWGLHFSDTLFTVVVSACDLCLLFLLFEQIRVNGLNTRTWRDSIVMSVLLYFGSAALYLSMGGTVWWTAHIVAAGCVILSLLLAFRRQYVWSAAALGCAFLTRDTLALGFPFLFYLAWRDVEEGRAMARFIASLRARAPQWSAIPWMRWTSIALVGGAALGLYMLRNQAMFGNPLESGYDILDAQRYPFVIHGLFNWRYVPANIINSFFSFPHVIMPTHYSYQPSIDMMNDPGAGVSVFLTTPLFLLLFYRNRRVSALRIALWVSIGIMTAFVLLYYTAGFKEFGTRYLFDIYPYAWLLLALTDAPIDWRFIALGLIGLGVNVLGAYQFWTGSLIHLPHLTRVRHLLLRTGGM